jgi:hypothetical protein
MLDFELKGHFDLDDISGTLGVEAVGLPAVGISGTLGT